MSDRSGPSPLLMGIVVLAVLGGGGAFLYFSAGSSTSTVPPGRTAPREREIPAAPEAGPAVKANRDDCIKFLRTQIGDIDPATVQGVVVIYPWVQAEALEALTRIDGADVEAELARILGGDGDPSDWDEARLRAVRLRIEAKRPEGEEALKAYLVSFDGLEDSELLAEAARCAARMEPTVGGGIVRRLLVDLENHDDDSLRATLEAAATLGEGATADELLAFMNDAEEDWEDEVHGAAAGALLRMGNDGADEVLEKALDPDGDIDFAEDLVLGLGARGNKAALPWLKRFLAEGDVYLRDSAAVAMGRIGDHSVIPDLLKSLKDEDKDVRTSVAMALASLGDSTGLADIRTYAEKGTDLEQRIRAWRLLGDLADTGSRDAAARLLAVPAEESRLKGYALVERVWAARLIAVLDAR